ncbi:MAG TPA: YfbM family protein [Polyangiaceae bacterium]|nr:YfbM family protein [Polyangiaceae bacterium]
MASRGVHFALSAEQAAPLLAAAAEGDDDAVMAAVEAIEEAWQEPFVAESDKAWEAIHRCLTGGTLLYEGGEYPLDHVICGGEQLLSGEADDTASFVTAEQVRDVASALAPLTKAWLRERYDRLDPDEYEGSDEDFEYTWENFEAVRALFRRAAEAGRAVLFTVDG